MAQSQSATVFATESAAVVVASIRTKQAWAVDTSFQASESFLTTTQTVLPKQVATSSSSEFSFSKATWTGFLAPSEFFGRGTITLTDSTIAAQEITSFVRSEPGISTSKGSASRRRIGLRGIANGTENVAGFYSAQGAPGVLSAPYALIAPNISTVFPGTHLLYDSESEIIGTAFVSGFSATYSLESTEENTGTFSYQAVGNADTIQIGIDSINSAMGGGGFQTVIDDVASGAYRVSNSVITTFGRTQTLTAGANTSFLEPISFMCPAVSAGGDLVWAAPRNRSSTQF
jgi:hypothetical protein